MGPEWVPQEKSSQIGMVPVTWHTISILDARRAGETAIVKSQESRGCLILAVVVSSIMSYTFQPPRFKTVSTWCLQRG